MTEDRFSLTRVRIGIVVWNTADLLDRCLASLPAAVKGLDAEIVVVDNDSADGSVEVAARHAGVSLIRNETNVGYAKAMNQALGFGAAGSTPPVVIALNPDTVPPPSSLAALVGRLLAQPDVGLVAPRLVNPDGTMQHSVYRFPSVAVSAAASFVPLRWQRGRLGRRYWLEGAAPHDRSEDIDWAIGAVHVVRAAAVEGPWYDERWFMYVEDLDLCWRLAQAGWRRVLEAGIDVVHVGNAAGSQAWGVSRTGRWLDATYDWYRLRHGGFAARRWAAVNTAGVLARMVPAAARRVGGRPLRTWERDLPRALPHHMKALRGR